MEKSQIKWDSWHTICSSPTSGMLLPPLTLKSWSKQKKVLTFYVPKKRERQKLKKKQGIKNSDIIQKNKHRSHYKWVLHYMYIMNNV